MVDVCEQLDTALRCSGEQFSKQVRLKELVSRADKDQQWPACAGDIAPPIAVRGEVHPQAERVSGGRMRDLCRVNGEGHYREPIQGADAKLIEYRETYQTRHADVGPASFPGADSRRVMAEIGSKQDSADKAGAEPQGRHAQREAAARGMADQDAAGRRASAIELVQKIR